MQPDQSYFYRRFQDSADEELAYKYANEPLADPARAAIDQLLVERGVQVAETLKAIAADAPPPEPEVLVDYEVPTEEVGSYSTAVEAEMVCGLLAQYGIVAMMSDAHTITTNHLWSNAIGGVRVKVMFPDADAARAIIERWQQDSFELEDEGDAPAPVEIGVGAWVPAYLVEKSRQLWFKRFVAMWLDFLLLYALSFSVGQWMPDDLHWVYQDLGLMVLYFWLAEGLTGCTIGKYLWGVRVVDPYGKKPGLFRTLPRTLLRLFELNPYLLGAIIGGGVAVMSKTGQRLGDMAGGTYVVDVEALRQKG